MRNFFKSKCSAMRECTIKPQNVKITSMLRIFKVKNKLKFIEKNGRKS